MPSRRSIFRCVVACAIWVVSTLSSFGHNPGLSTLRLDLVGSQLNLTLRFAPSDPNNDGRASAEELTDGKRLLERLVPSWVELSESAQPLSLNWVSFEADAASETIVARAEATCVKAGTYRLQLRHLAELSQGHREVISVFQDGHKVKEAVLSSRDPVVSFSLKTPVVSTNAAGAADRTDAETPIRSENWRTFLDFVRLGIEHILTGYDHMLYLAGLILACRRFRTIVPIVTSFTVAHSLTLGLATTCWVSLSPSVVEPLIAASIVYVGCENLWLKNHEPRRRWISALIFGLVHGFGFAGLLQEMGLGQHGGAVLLPLFSFNLGVECGQLFVVALVFPVLAWARNREKAAQWLFPVSSAAVAMIGFYWFVERVWA